MEEAAAAAVVAPRRGNGRHTVQEKLRVLDRMRAKRLTAQQAACGAGVTSETIRTWNKQEAFMRQAAITGDEGMKMLGRAGYSARLHRRVFDWYREQQEAGYRVTVKMLIEKAGAVYKDINPDDPPWKPANGWVTAFKRRHRISSLKPSASSAVGSQATAASSSLGLLLSQALSASRVAISSPQPQTHSAPPSGFGSGNSKRPMRGARVLADLTPSEMRQKLTRVLQHGALNLQSGSGSFQIITIRQPPNSSYDDLRTALPHAVETLVLHGTKWEYAQAIAEHNFDPGKVLFCGDDGTTTDRFFFFATCPGIAHRWRKEDHTEGGESFSYMVVSRLLWSLDGCIKLSGCTGGTIKVPANSHKLLQPLFIVRYRCDGPNPETFPLDPSLRSKHSLEADPTMALETAIMKDMIPTREHMTKGHLAQFR